MLPQNFSFKIIINCTFQKHHFRELTPEAQQALGESPEDFTNYWLSRFPLLLVHTWSMMQCVADETIFSQYYPGKFRYPEIDYSKCEIEQPPADFEENGGINEVDAQERADFMTKKKSPKKQQKVRFYERKKYGKKKAVDEAVGLYRSLDVVDASGVSVKDNEEVKNKPRHVRQRVKKQVEEPLVWNVSEK